MYYIKVLESGHKKSMFRRVHIAKIYKRLTLTKDQMDLAVHRVNKPRPIHEKAVGESSLYSLGFSYLL